MTDIISLAQSALSVIADLALIVYVGAKAVLKLTTPEEWVPHD